MIHRTNMIRTLNELTGERIVYVCAPSGYGKTVAVRQWLEASNWAHAVLSLDELDNTIARFCTRFCAALCQSQPKNAALEAIVAHAAFGGAPDEFSLRAVAALTRKWHTVLVIDDLHFIRNQKVLSLLRILLKRLPANYQILLINRNDLPPGFSDLWLRGNLVKITARQLRFSSDEIMKLYKKRGITISPEQAGETFRYTDGWAIGINALLLSGGAPSDTSMTFLEEFIRTNLWEKWDGDVRAFMLSTALVRELKPSLCSALSGVPDSEKMLRGLMLRGAFITQTGEGIYQYHALFHAFLERMAQECGDEYVDSLLKKEGEWHLNRRDFYSAVECFIRCDDHDGIARCFDMLEVTDRNDFVIERMLPIIMHPAVAAAAERFPFLHYMMAWAAFAQGRAQDMAAHMDQYYAHFPQIAARDPAHAHNIFYMQFMDYRTVLSDLKRGAMALSAAPIADGVRGSFTMNMPMLHRSTRDFSELAVGDTVANVEQLAGIAGWLFGDEAQLLIGSLTAGLLYEQGDLERAYPYAVSANAQIKAHFAPESKFCAMAVLLAVFDALGQPREAEHMIVRIADMIERDRAYYLSDNFDALQTRRKLARGDMEAAKDWLTKNGAPTGGDLSCYAVYVTVTTCRACIAAGDYSRAILLLTRVQTLVDVYKRPVGRIEASILLAIAYWKKKRGFQEEAMRNLENAVSIAYRYGYTQAFVNESGELAGMLRRLQKRVEQPGKQGGPPPSFIKKLYIRALEHSGGGLTSGQPEQNVKYTERQRVIMRLLCEGKSYREITQILEIKLPTLRSHISLIYKKLNVTGEAEAVAKIKAVGIVADLKE